MSLKCWLIREEKLRGHYCYYNCGTRISWQSVRQLLRYLSLEQPTDEHCHFWIHAAGMAKNWAHKHAVKNMKTKIPQMVFINYRTPNLTHIWLLLQIPGVERAYLSTLVIVGVLVLWHDEKVSDQTYKMSKGPRYSMPVMSEAPDPLFIWTLLQRASHTEQQQQQHSSLIRAALQLIEQDIQRQTQRVCSLES